MVYRVNPFPPQLRHRVKWDPASSRPGPLFPTHPPPASDLWTRAGRDSAPIAVPIGQALAERSKRRPLPWFHNVGVRHLERFEGQVLDPCGTGGAARAGGLSR